MFKKPTIHMYVNPKEREKGTTTKVNVPLQSVNKIIENQFLTQVDSLKKHSKRQNL